MVVLVFYRSWRFFYLGIDIIVKGIKGIINVVMGKIIGGDGYIILFFYGGKFYNNFLEVKNCRSISF